MTRMSWMPSGRPLVFAHRGGSRLAPENTMAAFDRAAAEGVDGFELDVRLSRDAEVVVCHDARLDRTCDARGAVADLSAAELARVDAGFRFVADDGTRPFRGRGLGVPMLRDVLARYPRHPLIVEMKEDTAAMAEATVSVLRETGALGRVCLGSFGEKVLRHARRLAPEAATGGSRGEVLQAMVCAWWGRLPLLRGYRALQVPERRGRWRVVTPRFVRAAHRSGVPVQVWVVDDEEDMRRLLGWGVDGLITDRPDVAVGAVGVGAVGRGRRGRSGFSQLQI
jgi:glycerophosphoryl diester phosphodiesterase